MWIGPSSLVDARTHLTLQEVVALMGIDLLRHREAWKARWSAMKDMVMAHIKKKAYAPEHTAKWLQHWDYQVRANLVPLTGVIVDSGSDVNSFCCCSCCCCLPSGFPVVFEKLNRSSFTFTFSV
jgi:hypothetical protein